MGVGGEFAGLFKGEMKSDLKALIQGQLSSAGKECEVTAEELFSAGDRCVKR